MKALCCALLACCALNAWADNARPPPPPDVIDARVMAVAEELRCLVCQNQSLADSHSALAADLRREIHELMVEGKSERDIVDYMVARYGDFVRYRPAFQLNTLPLWLGPFLLLLLAAWFLYRYFRKDAP